MSIYKSSIDGYRDTTKWLAAFTPVTAILTAVVVTGAPVGASLAGASDVGEWLGQHLLLVLCVLAVFVSVGAILWQAARVLSVQPKEVVTILDDTTPQTAKALETAFGAGILAPDFYSEASFEVATQVFYAALKPGQELPKDRDRLVLAFESLREWKLFTDTRRQFGRFLITIGIGALVICVAIAVAVTQIGMGGPITQPTRVQVTLGSNGAAALRQATGCTDPTHSTFYALRGTWDAPMLAVTGAGCSVPATWAPALDQAVVIPLS